MRVFKEKLFGEVSAYEVGYAPIGKPMMTVHFYILGEVCIDTGLSHMKNTVCEVVKGSSVKSILLTHHHEDHSGNASTLHSMLELPVYGHPLTIEKMKSGFNILPYQHLIWGKSTPVSMNPVPEILKTGKYEFKPVHTPGHSKDHLVYLEKNNGWLFSGDMYLADRIKFFRADERIKDEIKSLETILTLDFDVLFCGHNPQEKDGRKRIAQKLQYLQDIYGEVETMWKKGIDKKEIMHKAGLKEVALVKWFCFGNVSAENIIRSVISSLSESSRSNGANNIIV